MNQELQSLAQFEKEDQWFQSNFRRLQEKFANKFVAIKSEAVIASSVESYDIIEKAKKKTSDLTMVLIEFIPEKGLTVIV